MAYVAAALGSYKVTEAATLMYLVATGDAANGDVLVYTSSATPVVSGPSGATGNVLAYAAGAATGQMSCIADFSSIGGIPLQDNAVITSNSSGGLFMVFK